jgi:cytochrome P450
MDTKGSTSSFPTVFDTWAKQDEKRKFTPSLRQLTADAFTFHGAGTDTTAHTLTMGTWYLINDESCLAKLREELSKAISEPNSEMLVSLAVLENLPYLVSKIRRLFKPPANSR